MTALKELVEQFELEDVYALEVQGVPVVYTDEELYDAVSNMGSLGVLHSADDRGCLCALCSSRRPVGMGHVGEHGGRGKIRKKEGEE